LRTVVERFYIRIIVLSVLIVCHDCACTDQELYCGFQSGTILVDILPGSCSGMCVSPSNGASEMISIKAEQDTDIQIKVEEIPEPISFPEIKAEPDEVSYVSVCHQNIKIVRWFSGLCNCGLPTSVCSWVM
jgi:hypothetical protein